MTSSRIVLTAAALAAIALAVPAGASAATKGCTLPKGAKVDEQNKSIVVFTTGSGESRTTRGCYFKSGRTTTIDSSSGLRLAGALVTNVIFDIPGPAGTDGGTGVEVTDLKSGKRLFSRLFDTDEDNVEIDIKDIELTKSGTVVIIAEGDAKAEFPGGKAVMIAKKGAKQFTVLESGPGIVTDSLAISGKLAFWQNGATPKSAPLG
jgi:hypothetical protein